MQLNALLKLLSDSILAKVDIICFGLLFYTGKRL